MKILWIFFFFWGGGASQNYTIFRVISMHFRSFLEAKVQSGVQGTYESASPGV